MAILYVWKIKNKQAPNDINLEFSHSHRRSNQIAIVKPMPKVRGRLLSMYDNSFVVKAAKLWNKLPSNLSNIPTLVNFRRELQKYLSLYPDNPPIKGYFHSNNNSIHT